MELVIEGKTQGLKWSAAHVIPNHPKCGRLHGHDYTLDIKILMPVSVQNMKTVKEKGYLLDYGDVKKAVKEIIEPLDHKFHFTHCSIVIRLTSNFVLFSLLINSQASASSENTFTGMISVPTSSTRRPFKVPLSFEIA